MISKQKKLKLIVGISMIPILILLGLFLFTGKNVEIIRTVFTKDLTNDQIQDQLSEIGIRGQIVISILSALQVVVAILPAEPVQVIAGLTFGFWIGILCCMIGVIVGNTAIYALYRVFGDGLREYFGKKLDLNLEGAARSLRVALVIFVLYFLPAIPYGMICFLAAAVGMKYRRFIFITALGSVPSVCIGVGIGHIALESSWRISVIVFAALLVLLGLFMLKREFFMGKLNTYLEKPARKKSSGKNVKAYSSRKLHLPYVIFRLLILGRVKFKGTCSVDTIERPSIVLCSHGSFIDFAYAGTILKKESPNFVVARLYFYNKLTNRILRSFGCFPKSMFVNDTESAMNCLRVIRRGGVLAMMPEARLSTVGRFEDIQDSTFDFLKKIGVPVYAIRICGDYFAKPKWGKGLRRGALVEAELVQLFTPEQLTVLDPAEIKKRTECALYYDEFKWLEQHPEIRYRSRHLACGLENILTLCPECGASCSLSAKGHALRCEQCGLTAKLTDRYAFENAYPFPNLAVWYDWQTEQMRARLRADEHFCLRANVELRHASRDGRHMLELAGKGECTLNRDGLTYVGTEFGEQVQRHFAAKDIYRILFGAGEDFELYDGKEIYYFTPEDKRECVDWQIASTLLYEERTQARQKELLT